MGDRIHLCRETLSFGSAAVLSSGCLRDIWLACMLLFLSLESWEFGHVLGCTVLFFHRIVKHGAIPSINW